LQKSNTKEFTDMFVKSSALKYRNIISINAWILIEIKRKGANEKRKKRSLF